jgi:methionine synthase II (cobalamin-independent)
VEAQVRLAAAIGQKQQEQRQKWKAGEITEQEYKQWLKTAAEDLHQKLNPAP